MGSSRGGSMSWDRSSSTFIVKNWRDLNDQVVVGDQKLYKEASEWIFSVGSYTPTTVLFFLLQSFSQLAPPFVYLFFSVRLGDVLSPAERVALYRDSNYPFEYLTIFFGQGYLDKEVTKREMRLLMSSRDL
jgi:hypothetical protein